MHDTTTKYTEVLTDTNSFSEKYMNEMKASKQIIHINVKKDKILSPSKVKNKSISCVKHIIQLI